MIQLSVSDFRLHCRHPEKANCWSINVCDIVVIAEYTTVGGPHVDDYFLVFVTREQGEFYYSNVTMYAAGIDESLTKLESILGCSLEFRLQSSTDWNSRVVWPPELCGSAYFRYEEVMPEGLWGWVRGRLGGKRIESHLAEPIHDYLAARMDPPEV